MEPVAELRRREVETYLEVVAQRGADVGVEGFAVHNLAVFDDPDYATLIDVLAGAGATASFAFLGRDAEAQGESIERVDDGGHEVVCHGQRHVACGDLPHALAEENVEAGLASIEAAAGVRPSTFFAPLQTVNGATVDALLEADVERVVGRTEAHVPAALTVVEPEPLVDLELLMADYSAEAAFDELTERAETGGCFLMHPNLIEHYEATDQFHAWIDAFQPCSVAEWVERGGVGLLCDAVRPLRIA